MTSNKDSERYTVPTNWKIYVIIIALVTLIISNKGLLFLNRDSLVHR